MKIIFGLMQFYFKVLHFDRQGYHFQVKVKSKLNEKEKNCKKEIKMRR